MYKPLLNIYKFLEEHSLPLCILVISILFIFFYPVGYVTVDENSYFSTAEYLTESILKQDCNNGWGQIEVKTDSDTFCITKYNLGTSIILAPFIFINANLIFVASAIALLLSIYIFSRILNKLELSSIFLFFFVFYPGFLYQSRTILSEIFSVLFITFFLYLLIKSQKSISIKTAFLMGVLGGVITLIRYPHAFFIFIMMTVYIFQNYKNVDIFNLKNIAAFFIGLIPFILAFLFINNELYLSPIRTGYFYSNEDSAFSISNTLFLLPRYLIVLTSIYPLMIVIAFFAKSNLKYMLLPAFLIMVLFYSMFTGNNIAFKGEYTDLILGVRFLTPFSPVILILYFQFFQEFFKYRWFKVVIFIAIVLLLSNSVALFYIHQEFLLENGRTIFI